MRVHDTILYKKCWKKFTKITKLWKKQRQNHKRGVGKKKNYKKNYYNTGTILFTNHPTIDRKWSGRNPLVWQKMI